jgi:TIR domain
MMDRDPETVIEILRDSLQRGQSVEIEGLGTFRKATGGYDFAPQTQPRVFVAYVLEDLVQARWLCEALRGQGCSPWLDKDELLPGQNWPRAIQRAIESCDVFLACFSTRAILKPGQFQSELRYALDCACHMPLDATFFIPIRLEACAIPGRLAQIQYVDLFPDWDRGIKRLARAIHRAMRERQPVRPRLVVSK